MSKELLSKLLKYLPLGIGLLILGIGALFVPWREVMPYFSRLSITSYVAILVLGTAFYAAKMIRYYYMLKVLNSPRSLIDTIFAYFTAQPIALLPAGEVYRVVTLNEHANVPKSKGVSIVFIQSFTENIAMIILALVSVAFFHQYALVVLGLFAAYIAVFVVVRTKRTAERSHRALNKLPFFNFARASFHGFIDRNQTLLSGKSLWVLLLSGFVSTLIASTLLFVVANDLGIKLDITQAIVAFTLPTVLQNISFLPGGIGINEQGTVGILVLLGSAFPAAVALTIIMRFVTLALGVIIGLISILFARKR